MATGTTIYSGPLTVPAASRQYPYPNPWSIDLVLPQPLIYQRSGGNLLLDLTLTGRVDTTAPKAVDRLDN